MRLLLLTALALTATASAAAPVTTEKPSNPLRATATDNCPRTTSHYASRGSMFRGKPLTPKKLTELPQAVGYMAVYRTVNGCEVPMTIVEYRTGRRP